MEFFPSFPAHEPMEVSNEVVIFRDHDRYRGFHWHLATALKAKGWACFDSTRSIHNF
jgi:hypothetical protein